MTMKTAFIDTQRLAKAFSVGDSVLMPIYTRGNRYAPGAGRVTAVLDKIGFVDVETVFGNIRFSPEDLVIDNSVDTSYLEDTSQATWERDRANAVVRRVATNTKTALYWRAKGRKYMPCKSERENGSYSCPNCREPLGMTHYKKHTRLYVCRSCLFTIRPSDIMLESPVEVPDPVSTRRQPESPFGSVILLEKTASGRYPSSAKDLKALKASAIKEMMVSLQALASKTDKLLKQAGVPITSSRVSVAPNLQVRINLTYNAAKIGFEDAVQRVESIVGPWFQMDPDGKISFGSDLGTRYKHKRVAAILPVASEILKIYTRLQIQMNVQAEKVFDRVRKVLGLIGIKTYQKTVNGTLALALFPEDKKESRQSLLAKVQAKLGKGWGLTKMGTDLILYPL